MATLHTHKLKSDFFAMERKLHYNPVTLKLKMNQMLSRIFFIVAVVLTLNANADFWSSSVDTNSSHWYVYRQSSNVSFNLSSTVEGNISPVESHGRMLQPYHSCYKEIRYNDVQLSERTSAFSGYFKSADELQVLSAVYPNEIEIVVSKPAGTNIYTIEYTNETWPVFIRASRDVDYSGQQINDRDFEGNNGDFVGSNMLYNHRLSKEQISVIWLEKMNSTVLTNDDSIVRAEFKPTKYLGYLIRANTTGIADLSYRLRDSQYDIKHQNYPTLSEGEERYYGVYHLTRKIELESAFERYDKANSWLPCCDSNWTDISYIDERSFGIGDKDIFDCSWYNRPCC